MAAVITGGILAGMTVAQLVSMGASAAGGVASLLAIIDKLHQLGLKPSDPVPPEHHDAVIQAIAQLSPQPPSDQWPSELPRNQHIGGSKDTP